MFARYIAVGICMIFGCCGCTMFLPAGDPPKGDIVDNRLPEKLSREEMILALGSRISASAMEHFSGGPVAVDAKNEAAIFARAAIREAGNICGVRFEQVAAAVLSGRRIDAVTYEFELFHFSRSLWRCTYILKKR